MIDFLDDSYRKYALFCFHASDIAAHITINRYCRLPNTLQKYYLLMILQSFFNEIIRCISLSCLPLHIFIRFVDSFFFTVLLPRQLSLFVLFPRCIHILSVFNIFSFPCRFGLCLYRYLSLFHAFFHFVSILSVFLSSPFTVLFIS